MKQNKYIIVETDGLSSAVVFEEVLSHKYVAGRMWVISAGFFSVDAENKTIDVYGKSVTLKISSKPEDKLLIERLKFPEKAIW